MPNDPQRPNPKYMDEATNASRQRAWMNSAIDPEPTDLPEPTGLEALSSVYALGARGRRRKAAVTLTALWGGTVALHLSTWGSWVVVALTALIGVHALRVLLARPASSPEPLPSVWGENAIATLANLPTHHWPYVSILVAAKNEDAVIGNLVEALVQLDYPQDRYDLWMIDDASTDGTADLLDRLARQYPQVNVIHRSSDAVGGKSGALNQVWPLTQGELFVVFDADAKVSADLLRRVVPLFDQPQVGAVQVRKAIANAATNFWTRGQRAEMALDSFFQRQRIAVGGIGELRGNGQFVRRTALEVCGGWNEATITDDLDLTLRLHLNCWDIAFMEFPAVQEEGVTTALGLWHQRNRWAEGGYQRYLDYWRLIAQNRMGFGKTVDLLAFCITQYLLPTVAVPDLLLAVVRSRTPLFGPVAGLTVTLSVVAMFSGLRRTQKTSLLVSLLQTLRGTIYMFHWLLVMSTTMMRVSVRPKRLKWVKTTHQGLGDEVSLDLPG